MNFKNAVSVNYELFNKDSELNSLVKFGTPVVEMLVLYAFSKCVSSGRDGSSNPWYCGIELEYLDTKASKDRKTKNSPRYWNIDNVDEFELELLNNLKIEDRCGIEGDCLILPVEPTREEVKIAVDIINGKHEYVKIIEDCLATESVRCVNFLSKESFIKILSAVDFSVSSITSIFDMAKYKLFINDFTGIENPYDIEILYGSSKNPTDLKGEKYIFTVDGIKMYRRGKEKSEEDAESIFEISKLFM